MPTSEDILNAFTAGFEGRYQLVGRLGEGAAGVAYRFTDRRRGVDVCAKLYHGALPTISPQRDWIVTSTIKHPLIADTFTVEAFTCGDQEHHAMVSRYVDGCNLETVLARTDTLSAEEQSKALDALLTDVGCDICEGVAALHGYGRGHGDLHERNVVVREPDPVRERMQGRAGRHLEAVIIDLDNATHKQSGRTVSETDHMQSDVRALRSMLLTMARSSRWRAHLTTLLDACDSVHGLRAALVFALGCVGSLHATSPAFFTRGQLSHCLTSAVALSIAPQLVSSAAPIQFVRGVVAELDLTPEFEVIEAEWRDRVLNDPTYPGVSATFHVVDAGLVGKLLS